MFSRRSSIGQTLIKIPKSDVNGKSCQNIKLKCGEKKNSARENVDHSMLFLY